MLFHAADAGLQRAGAIDHRDVGLGFAFAAPATSSQRGRLSKRLL